MRLLLFYGTQVKPAKEPAMRAEMMVTTVAVLALSGCFSAVLNGFVDYDDPLYITDATVSQGITATGVSLAFTSVDKLYWHPLTWLSHELDFDLFGSSPAAHHFTSVFLHALTAGLFCLLCLKLGASVYYAAGASMLWALHPLRVESFAWIAERKDVLCALFFVATLIAYLRYAHHPSRTRVTWLGLAAQPSHSSRNPRRLRFHSFSSFSIIGPCVAQKIASGYLSRSCLSSPWP
jgi:hypothetical protein